MPNSQDVRIEWVTIENFRGILGPLRIDFLNKNDIATSWLIHGENGTGKSTFLDAIEWNLQGIVDSAYAGGQGHLIRNVNSNAGETRVTVGLSGGANCERRYYFDEQKSHWISTLVESRNFHTAPIMIKRSQIVHFFDLLPQERGRAFRSFKMLADVPEDRKPTLQRSVQRAQYERASLKLDSAIESLTSIVGVPLALRNGNSLEVYIQEHVVGARQKGEPRKSAEKRLAKLPLNIRMALKVLDEARVERAEAKRLLSLSEGRVSKVTLKVDNLASLLNDIDFWLTRSFKEVSGLDELKNIEVKFGQLSTVSLDLEFELKNGQIVRPENFLSEGNRDLVALLFYLSAIKTSVLASGQPKVLILDDVFQSVDAGIRLKAMSLILREFADWQIFISTHDMLWRMQVSELLSLNRHRFGTLEVTHQGTSAGSLVVKRGHNPSHDLRVLLKDGSPGTVNAVTGRLLEQICERLSWTLALSVTRKRHDFYTLGDLWPVVSGSLARFGLALECQNISHWILLRNNSGAHYKEWAEVVSRGEALDFANSVLTLFGRIYCESCSNWIEKRSGNYQCVCGDVSLARAKAFP